MYNLLKSGIFLSIVYEAAESGIECENSVRQKQAEMVRKEEELKTTKEDKENHGYGIKNVGSVVQRYGGETSISINGSMFSISMIIPV